MASRSIASCWMHRAPPPASFAVSGYKAAAHSGRHRKLARTQQRLLTQLWNTLAEDGYLLYVTCSVLPQENSAIITTFLQAHDDAEEVAMMSALALHSNMAASACRRSVVATGFIMRCCARRHEQWINVILRQLHRVKSVTCCARFAYLLPAQGEVLDLACGLGADALLLAARASCTRLGQQQYCH